MYRDHDRERAETHGAETMAFKVATRRNGGLALWAAHLMGLLHGDSESYVKRVVSADIGHAPDHTIIERVTHDLHRAGVPTPRAVVAAKFVQLEAMAHAELAAQDTRGV